jgi:methylated-DNA-protein-cysteine methyltransferase related protein
VPHIRLPSTFAASVYQVVRAIPRGRVMTYGQIAGLIAPPAGADLRGYERVKARWVGYAMAECPQDVPWHRVVNSRGRISLPGGEAAEVQRLLLADEGVVFMQAGQIELARFRWEPGPEWYASHPEFLPPSGPPTSPAKDGGRA